VIAKIHPEAPSMTLDQTVPDQTAIHDEVRARYAEAARSASAGRSDSAAQTSCCGPDGSAAVFGEILYADADRAALPDAAVLASLGCGNPTAVAELREGEHVLDLGSGGGIDVILSARRVGPSGLAFGLDMTDEMLDLAVRNAADAGVTNVEFVRGTIESIPLPSSTIDVVISNCVINLAADKAAVFREIARVLRPGGRIGVSDVVAVDELSSIERAERGSFTGCIAGALSFSEYRTGLAAVGLTDIELVPTHAVADGLHATIIRATKPAVALSADALPTMPTLPRPLEVTSSSCGCGSGVCC
jgi:SAM-dependent methyltransferase